MPPHAAPGEGATRAGTAPGTVNAMLAKLAVVGTLVLVLATIPAQAAPPPLPAPSCATGPETLPYDGPVPGAVRGAQNLAGCIPAATFQAKACEIPTALQLKFAPAALLAAAGDLAACLAGDAVDLPAVLAAPAETQGMNCIQVYPWSAVCSAVGRALGPVEGLLP